MSLFGSAVRAATSTLFTTVSTGRRSIAPAWRVPQPPQATSFCASRAARRASNAAAIRP